jgi:SOS-response transcriptional repressor LexA
LQRAEEYRNRAGHVPSMREIARELKMAHTTLREHVHNLAGLGWVRLTREAPGYEVVRTLPGSPAFLAGEAGAGPGVYPVDDAAEAVPLPKLLQPARGHSYVRVRGDSMSGDAILAGDVVVVRAQDSVDPQEIALVALADGTYVVKRVRREGRRVLLVSSNPAYPPREAEKGTRVAGKVVRVIRDLE